MSAPSTLARGSSPFSRFTRLVHGTAKPRNLELLQTRADRARRAGGYPGLDSAFLENR